MAAPNLRSPLTVIGQTAGYAATTGLAAALSNGAASGKVLRISTIRAANVGSLTVSVDVSRRRSGTDVYLCRNTPMAPGNALVVISKEELFYLEEGDAIFARASANTTVDLLISYEDIS